MINAQAIRTEPQANRDRTDFVGYQRRGSRMTFFTGFCLIWLISFGPILFVPEALSVTKRPERVGAIWDYVFFFDV